MPPFVGAIGLRRMLSKFGTINLVLMKVGLVSPDNPIDFLYRYRMLGCMLVMALHVYPLLYLNLAAAISNIDPSLIESATSLCLTRWQVFKCEILASAKACLIADC